MVEGGETNVTISLHIKSLTMKVETQTNVFVLWARGTILIQTRQHSEMFSREEAGEDSSQDFE